MPLETGSFISDLNSSNPAATDAVSQGDDHIRLIKGLVKATFPNVTGAVTATHTQLQAATDAVNNQTYKFLPGTISLPGIAWTADPDTGLWNPSTNSISGAVGGVRWFNVASDKTVTFDGTVNITGNVSIGGSATIGAGVAVVPTGSIIAWTTDVAPAGYLFCNGAAVSRSTYSSLFSTIGTAYGGGDGSTTFNVPNWCETVPVGKATMGGVSARGLITHLTLTTLGAVVGAGVHTLSATEMPAHTHTASASSTASSSSTASTTGAHTHTISITDPGHTHITNGTFVNVGSGGTLTLPVGTIVSNTNVATTSSTTGISAAASSNGDHTHTIATTTTVSTSVTNASAGSGGSHNNVQPSSVTSWIIKT